MEFASEAYSVFIFCVFNAFFGIYDLKCPLHKAWLQGQNTVLA